MDAFYYAVLVFNLLAVSAFLYNCNKPRKEQWLRKYVPEEGNFVVVCMVFIGSFVPFVQLLCLAFILLMSIVMLTTWLYAKNNPGAMK